MKTDKKTVDNILLGRYPNGSYALLKEVSDAAGFNRSRSADYVVMNLWPSRGLHLTGIELKSFRGDWLNELKNPQKAENIFQYCDFFYLLTTDDTIAKIEEIPATWGWLTIKGGKIHTMKEAPKLSPKEVSRNFLAALLKRATTVKSDYVHVEHIQDRISEAYERGKNEKSRSYEYDRKSYTELKKEIEAFEIASGIKLNGYSLHYDKTKIGQALKFIIDGGFEKQQEELLLLKQKAESISEHISSVCALITQTA